jgi:hypothetical protein
MTPPAGAPGQSPKVRSPAGPRGLGGWLILPMVGLAVGAVRSAVGLVQDFVPILTEGYWDVLTDPAGGAYHPLWALVLMFEIAGISMLVLLQVATLLLIFLKKRFVPRVFATQILLFIAYTIVDGMLALQLPVPPENAYKQFGMVLVMSIGAAIWIPYFFKSARVKNTFVN